METNSTNDLLQSVLNNEIGGEMNLLDEVIGEQHTNVAVESDQIKVPMDVYTETFDISNKIENSYTDVPKAEKRDRGIAIRTTDNNVDYNNGRVVANARNGVTNYNGFNKYHQENYVAEKIVNNNVAVMIQLVIGVVILFFSSPFSLGGLIITITSLIEGGVELAIFSFVITIMGSLPTVVGVYLAIKSIRALIKMNKERK